MPPGMFMSPTEILVDQIVSQMQPTISGLTACFKMGAWMYAFRLTGDETDTLLITPQRSNDVGVHARGKLAMYWLCEQPAIKCTSELYAQRGS